MLAESKVFEEAIDYLFEKVERCEALLKDQLTYGASIEYGLIHERFASVFENSVKYSMELKIVEEILADWEHLCGTDMSVIVAGRTVPGWIFEDSDGNVSEADVYPIRYMRLYEVVDRVNRFLSKKMVKGGYSQITTNAARNAATHYQAEIVSDLLTGWLGDMAVELKAEYERISN